MAPAPSIGRIVTYRSKTGGYDLPAIVTATKDSLSPAGVIAGNVPDLESDFDVHLHVFTPGQQRHYQEFGVPFEAAVGPGEIAPGSWRWPERR